MHTLETLNPLDGRYAKDLKPLAGIFSEKGLINYRVFVELKYLELLSEKHVTDLRKFTPKEKESLLGICNLSEQDFSTIKKIEECGYKDIKATNHDVKAIEYFLKDKMSQTTLKDCVEWIHFGLTSEDINNIAYSLMLSDAVSFVFIPCFEDVLKKMSEISINSRNVSMLARTHGQPASPTTMGKEFAVFVERIKKQIEQLKKFQFPAKLNGATGNFNAHTVAYPKVNWKKFTEDLIKEFNKDRKIKLLVNHFTTQIESHDGLAELFDSFRRINVILLGFNQDVWRYISDGWFVQKAVEGEVGSSTMPHKINPIDFEKSEGNLGLANALFSYFSNKLPVSRLQRDLSDSTVLRNIGVAFGYSFLAYKSIAKGLGKISVNKEKILNDLNSHPEVITEGIQTVLRSLGEKMPYEQLKKLTRGKQVSIDDIHKFIDGLNVSDEIKKRLKKITPENYIGIAGKK